MDALARRVEVSAVLESRPRIQRNITAVRA